MKDLKLILVHADGYIFTENHKFCLIYTMLFHIRQARDKKSIPDP